MFYNIKEFASIRQEYQVHLDQGLLDLHHRIMIHQLELDWRQELRN